MVTQIKAFDKSNLKALAAAVQIALGPVEKEFGVKFTYQGSRYYPATATLKLEANVLKEDGEAESKLRTMWKMRAASFGLNPDWLDKKINVGGTIFTVVGLRPSAKKYPVIVMAENGAQYRMPALTVKLASLHVWPPPVPSDDWMASGE
jgi:hypothetical protein